MAVAMDAMAVAIHIKYALNQNCPILYTVISSVLSNCRLRRTLKLQLFLSSASVVCKAIIERNT